MQSNSRQAEAAIDPMFIARYSPRAFDGRALTLDQVRILLEASRWSPSCYNAQPWNFVYSLQGSSSWKKFVSLLVPFNQEWAQRSGALFFIVSRKNFEHNQKPNAHHAFDSGAAWMSLALQASKMGLSTHAMAGVNFEEAARLLKVPEGYQVLAAIAVGYAAPKETLPPALQEKEVLSDRKKCSEFVFADEFGLK